VTLCDSVLHSVTLSLCETVTLCDSV